MDNFSNTNLRHIYYRTTKQYVFNIFRITVIKQVIWDRITRLRKCLWYTRPPNASCALGLWRFCLECALEDIFRLKPVIRLNIAWLSTNRMEAFMSTKWLMYIFDVYCNSTFTAVMCQTIASLSNCFWHFCIRKYHSSQMHPHPTISLLTAWTASTSDNSFPVNSIHIRK